MEQQRRDNVCKLVMTLTKKNGNSYEFLLLLLIKASSMISISRIFFGNLNNDKRNIFYDTSILEIYCTILNISQSKSKFLFLFNGPRSLGIWFTGN